MKNILTISCFLCLLFGSLVSCGTEEDTCSTLACLNDGTCVNGDCACPEGFEGEDCSIQLDPVSMSIIGINVTKYPVLRSDSSSWDSLPNSGADLFFAFHEGTTSTYDPSTDFVSNTLTDANGQALEVNATPPYRITTLTTNWSLDLWDADGVTDEYMDGIILLPLDEAAGLPTTFEVETPTMKATFFVQWDF